MQKVPTSSQKVQPPKEPKKSAPTTPARHPSNTLQSMGSNSASGRPRKSKTDAYTTAPWVGAAPTGNRKRAVSTVEHTTQPSKKVKKALVPSKPNRNALVTPQAPRRKPVIINLDNDEEDNEEDTMDVDESSRSRKHHRPAILNANNGSESTSEPGENTDGTDSEGNDDLTGLHSTSLQKKITSERPQWRNHLVEEATTHQEVDPSDFFDDIYEDADMHSLGHHDMGTTSDFDGALDEAEDKDDSTEVVDGGSEEASANEQKHRKNTKKSGSSKRDVARLSESASPDESSNNGGNHKYQDVNLRWPDEAHYTPVLPKARNLSIREQPLPMRRIICAAFTLVTGNSLFNSAYPSAEKVEFETYHRDVFIKCAKCLKYFKIVKHLQCDDELVKLCACVINARISNLHTQCKKVTDGKVEGFYQLLAGEEAIKRVKALTDEDQDYIYPINPHETCFSSSMEDGPGKDELELPIPMVCIVATTTHASLDDWSQGYKRSKSDFRADAYEYIYRGHELFLNTLHEKEPEFYHSLMSDLYKAVAVKGVHSATHMANNAMARLNLPARAT
ncbi:hypothetical protein BYT27DRAFT_7266604 [Phlegmacium glaucopus]|nr:hypothetical protein BYT27DRAFT_7266604 [Phlegmacium glaucopus]